ncbi:MAG: rhodanese-like domain-containing protein [Clostridiales bacterium]|nr:rhodanese-like domain-containing protein [Clostridiales bacterium]
MMESQEVIIVDVREQYEYKEGHIKNAQLIPVDTILNQAPTLLTNKNAKIIVYCRSGNRSKMAAEILVKLGYTNIFEMGGINSWPYEIVK